jgi:hypothetical protein
MRYETMVDRSTSTITTYSYPSPWDRLVGIVKHPIMFIQWLCDKDRVFD